MANVTLHAPGAHPGGAADGVSAAPPVSATGEIAVSEVRKYFGVTRALDGCTFSAKLGEIHAIVGGNGSGKSTLAKVMSGVLPADSGQVSVLGHAPGTPHQAREIGVATVFQEVLVADECTVIDNLFLGADGLWSKTLPTRLKVKAAAELMADLTGAEFDVEALVGSLPLSMKQWITIGRALLQKPRVLILDESSAALDLDATERLHVKMRELRDQGSAVLIVTHRIAELIRVSDRATVLRDGRDVGILEKGEITEKNLLGLMTGKSETAAASAAPVREVLRHDVVLRTHRMRIWPASPEVSVSLHKGEVLGVAGLDGQGQSDFVRILAGIQRAVAGAPVVRDPEGGVAEIKSLADASRFAVSYVSGDRKREGIFANLSIFENLLMPLYRRTARLSKLAVIDWKTLESAFGWEVERLAVRMGDRTNKITSLSGGNQQKVLIGRAFALNPDILVLNDPARGVDVGAKGELYKHLSAFAARGKSVVYLSSEIEEFTGFCTRVLVFRHGGVFAEFAGRAIDPDRILEAMFGQSPGLHGETNGAEVDADDSSGQAGTNLRAAPSARLDAGRIKIVDFGAEPARQRPAARTEAGGEVKIVEFGPAAAHRPTVRVPAAPTHIKVVDFEEGARASRPGSGASGRSPSGVKVVEFDRDDKSAPRAEPRVPPVAVPGRIKIVEFGGEDER